MSVAQAQQAIDSREYAEWLAYYSRERFTADRIENMLAIICCILANVHRKKGGKDYEPEDFIPKYGSNRRRFDTPEEMMTKLRAIFPNGND